MRACGLNSLVVCFDVKTCDITGGDVTTRSEIETKNICFLGFQDMREGVTSRRLILWSL